MKWLDAQEEFESWFQGKGSFVFQFEDAREAMGISQSRKVFTKGQPADYLVTSLGVTFFAEVKSCHDEVSFPLSNIKRSQWSACIQVVAAQGQYWFYLRKEPEGLWFKIPGSFFVDLQKAQIKSVKWSQLESFKYVRI